jgi:ribosomal protein S18 acetylase RimI-like enzyme
LSIAVGVRLGPVLAEHRVPLENIVRATKVFSEDEVGVALELLDATLLALDARRPTDYEFIGAFEGDELVGYACFGATPSTDNTFDLYWIAVHPEAQRTGAGAALMTEVERRLQARGARLIVVETSSRTDYTATRRFYAKRGYEQSAQVDNFYAPGDHRVIFTKSLAA